MEPLRILFVEDTQSDAELAIRQLKAGGLPCTWLRVETEADLRRELKLFGPQLILSDFSLPGFGGLEALDIARECAPGIPFVFLSGTIGEERAIDALQRGAVDYVLKTNMARLVPAVKRALEHAALQREKHHADAQVARLTRVLKLQSGTNAAIVRTTVPNDLLAEVCRLATHVGGYAAAVVSLIDPGTRTARPTVWDGAPDDAMRAMIFTISDAPERDTSMTGRVLRTAEPCICNDVAQLDPQLTDSIANLTAARFQSSVVLPLLVDHTAIGAIALTALDRNVISNEELAMLRELAGNLSFALQYRQKEDELKYLSYFDPLTGLAKRSVFCERLSRRLQPHPGRRGHPAVAIFDVEQLSTINDTYGRHSGDVLLQRIAHRMKSQFESTDGCAHLGGGTFGIALELEGTEEEVFRRLQEEVTAIFAQPFSVEGRHIPIEVKSGFARFPQNGEEASALVQNAEAALRAAKQAGEKYLHHRLELSSAVVSRMKLEHRLREAIEKQEFELHYQPQVHTTTRRIVAVEALLRWRNPELNDGRGGLVPPGEFLPVLEQTGMIVTLGDWILRQATTDVQRWRSLGLPPLRVAVNISPIQLRRRAFADQFLATVGDDWMTPTSGLDIEITEGALVDDMSAIVTRLRRLQRHNVRIAIDDFGTGYSSLSRLSKLPIDTLKIDRSFTTQIATDPTGAGTGLVSVIVSLSKLFHMTTVAEGVETEAQFNLLRQLGCDQSQGYLHSKPVPREEAERLMREGSGAMLLPAQEETIPRVQRSRRK